MDFAQALSAANALSVDDRIRLAEAIWEGIEGDRILPLTDAQKRELERRLAAYEASPEKCTSWDQVEAEARARLRQ